MPLIAKHTQPRTQLRTESYYLRQQCHWYSPESATAVQTQEPLASTTTSSEFEEKSVFRHLLVRAKMATVGLFHTGTPIQQPSIARPPSTSIPQAGEPASEPYLGFSLNLFGPFGLQWMKERQSLDDVFRDQEAIHNAELVLGHPMQKLDHTYDPHFPTNVGRFGLITVSAAQRIKKEPKNKQSRGLCSRSTRIGSCSSCKSCVPTFVYT